MVECPKCGSEFEAEGKIARCPDCRATFRNEAETPKKKKKDKPKKDKKPEPPAKKDVPVGEDMYGFTKDEEDLGELRKKREVEEEKRKEEKKKAPKPQIQIKRKNIGDLEIWSKVDKAMIWLLVGTIVWAVYHFFQGVIVFLGIVQGPEYAAAVVRWLIRPEQGAFELGQGDTLDRVSFCLAMLGGSNLVGTSFVLLLLMQVLSWIQTGTWMAGYAIAWQGTPNMENEGSRGQLITLFVTGALNFLFGFFLVFLPLVGAFSYVLMPYWCPEMAMALFNMERSVPLHIFWSYSPFWETLLTIIIVCSKYLEPIMISYFIWTVASTLKDDVFQQRALGTLRMGCSVAFLFLVFDLFALTGTSPVLVKVLRLFYLLWYMFMVAWILRLAALIGKTREVFHFFFFPDDE